MRSLVWFRSDLRTRDNTALSHACARSDDGVIAVFAICPKQWAAHDWGSMKVDFVLRNVRALEESLAALNIPLKLIKTDHFEGVPRAMLRLAKHHGCHALFFNEEYEVNERRRDVEVTRLLEEDDIAVKTYTDQVILDIRMIRTNAGGWYSKFTPFKRKWLSMLEEDGLPEIRPKPRRQKRLPIESDEVPNAIRGFKGHTRPDLWDAGEAAARRRLKNFVAKRIDSYDEARDFPAMEGTSGLSPYLATGVLSPRACLEAAIVANEGKASGGSEGVATWISELIWREFYRHILIGFPRICMNRPFLESTAGIPWRQDEQLFRAWCEGRTGFPIVDAAMRQLAKTGWMHNRLRMIVAMFLTKDLFNDWRWGEAHFMRHLVDGDFASNNGGWQWSASTGTDAAPYFRVFNPYSQSRRYGPDGEFIRRYVPELASLTGDAVHEPDEAQAREAGYPMAIVDRTRTRDRVIKAFRKHSGKARTRG